MHDEGSLDESLEFDVRFKVVDAHVHFPMGRRVRSIDSIAETMDAGRRLGVEMFWNLGDVLRLSQHRIKSSR